MKTKVIQLLLAALPVFALSSCLRHEGYYGKAREDWPAPSYSGYCGNKSYAWQNSSDHAREYRGLYY